MNHAPTLPTNQAPQRRRWALARGAASTWDAFVIGWRRLPPGAFRRWAATLCIGFVACAALAFVIASAGRRHSERLTEWDARLVPRVERGPLSFADAVLLESFGNLAYMIPLTVAATVVAARRGRALLALSFPAAYVLQRGLVLIGWWTWDRQRPRLIAGGLAAPPLHSFPSGHVALALAVYGLLAWLWIRASRSIPERVLACVLLAALLLATGWARVRLGAHWPSDVLAGYTFGAMWLVTVVTALKRAEQSHAD